jgi:hypothetical protein
MHRRVNAVLLLILTGLLMLVDDTLAQGTCPPGYVEAEPGTCMERGAVYCGGGKTCPKGSKCVRGGGCVVVTAPEKLGPICPGGNRCLLGEACAPGNQCYDPTKVAICGKLRCFLGGNYAPDTSCGKCLGAVRAGRH